MQMTSKDVILPLFTKFAAVLLLCLLFAIALAGWQTDFFEIYDNNAMICSIPAAHSQMIETSYVHSVEKTTVLDLYRIANGKIYSWEERVKSSNAGMPSVLPEYMHFYTIGDYIVFRGGRIASDIINLRSGNEVFGKNTLHIAPLRKIELYKYLPNRKLTLKISRRPYVYQPVYLSVKLSLLNLQKSKE